MSHIDAIVIGASAGGVEAINSLLSKLEAQLSVPILVVIHVAARSIFFPEAFYSGKDLKLKEAEDKDCLEPGCIFFAPADYHLLVEKNHTLSLSSEEPVLYSRPSIDVLFKSAADVYGASLLGILLTGANEDGADGLFEIKKQGGLAIVQDPKTAQCDMMPQSALKLFRPDHVLSPAKIGELLPRLVGATQPINISK